MMTDGLNQARAMRVSEIVTDYRTIQSRIASFRANPSAEDYNEVGFALLRQCECEARAILAQPFATAAGNGNRDEEQIKRQLRGIIVDSAVRRFRVQKIFLRMTAAIAWVSRRNQVLRGGRRNGTNAAALDTVTQALRQDLMIITDVRVESSLRNADIQAGKWLSEDPPLCMIQRITGS